MFVTCIFAKHSIWKGLFLSQINICCTCEDVYWPNSRGWMRLHVCGFWIWRLDLEKSGNGRLSCCRWPRESNIVGTEWGGAGGVEGGSFGTRIHLWAARAWSVIREVVVAEGSCPLPRGWVTLTGAMPGQEWGFWQPASICVHEWVKCEGTALTFSEK